MSEKQKKTTIAEKTSVKKSESKKKSAQTVRTRSAGSQKKRTRTTRKKKQRTVPLIIVLSLLCVLLLTCNLYLVLKLVPSLKNSLQNRPSTPAGGNSLTALPQSVPKAPQHKEQPAGTGSDSEEMPQLPVEKIKEKTQLESASSAVDKTVSARSIPASPAAAGPAVSVQEEIKKKQPVARHTRPSQRKKTSPAEKKTGKAAIAEKDSIRSQSKKKVQNKPVTEKPPAHSGQKKTVQPLAKPEQPQKKISHAGTLMFVFDDAGHNLAQLEYFLQLPFPCTIAVLPQLRYSTESARRTRKAGKQVILHQPMQAIDPRINPGPGAIIPGLSKEQIKAIVRKNLEQIWPAAGMNNHEGSLMTEDAAAMDAVLEVTKEKNIFFLDSRTTAKSVVPKVAKEKNMVVWERAIFIDNEKDRLAMETQIKKGMAIARRTGSAILIGHVFTTELAELLTDMYPLFIEEGFSLSSIAASPQKRNEK